MFQDVFSVGEDIEVNGFRGDDKLCFYAGTVRCMHRRLATIEFKDLKRPTGQPLVRKLPFTMLRPKPPGFTYDFKCGDGIEIWENSRWYKGKFVSLGYIGRYFCEIYRPDGEQGEEYVCSLRYNVRPSQQWRLKDGASVWKHRRLVRPAAVGF